MLYNTEQDPDTTELHDPMEAGKTYPVPTHDRFEDLLQPIFRSVQLVADLPDIHTIRAYGLQQIAQASAEITDLNEPAHYPVGLESDLYKLKMHLIDNAKVQSTNA